VLARSSNAGGSINAGSSCLGEGFVLEGEGLLAEPVFSEFSSPIVVFRSLLFSGNRILPALFIESGAPPSECGRERLVKAPSCYIACTASI
jgi:hypothetical protein